MPRKVNYGLDYDDDFYDDDYDDYAYDDADAEDYEGPDTKQETIKPGLWQCSICTYDNDESMTFCDICGVVRRSLVNTGTSNSNKTDPFKFNVPSPDDVVYTGLRSSKTGLKGILPSTNLICL